MRRGMAAAMGAACVLLGAGSPVASAQSQPPWASLSSHDALSSHARSTHRYADLSRRAARRLAERAFPALIGRADGAPAILPNGLEIAQPLSETSARVETA